MIGKRAEIDGRPERNQCFGAFISVTRNYFTGAPFIFLRGLDEYGLPVDRYLDAFMVSSVYER